MANPKRVVGLAALLLGGSIALAAGCGNTAFDAANGGSGGGIVGYPGASCDVDGQVGDCGSVEQHYGDYVACSFGTTTCKGGAWSACRGDQISVRSFNGGGLTVRTLGASTGCGASNPCDPNCNQFVDNGLGVLLEGGFSVNAEGGLTISTDAAATPDAAAIANGFVSSPNGLDSCTPNRNVNDATTTCTTANEYANCQQDWHCDQAAGKCVFNNGPGWIDLRCNGYDLTVEPPCDLSGTSYFPICNRGLGTVPGNTPIAINYTNPPTAPNGCTPIAGPPDCTVTVPASGLGAGQCMDAIGCGPPGDKFVVINASANVARLTECSTAAGNACRNNATYGKTVGGGCTSCATTCTTTVSGRVYDPGKNVPLPGVTVFNPTGSLKTLPTGVSCDTCDSVGSPMKSATFSAVDGSFRLPVTPGTNVPVVFQSGRWRRQITVPNVIACQDNVIPNSGATETRLPKTTAEGNIPFTAIVTGSHEAAECLLAKIGVATTEFGNAPTTPSYNGKPIHLFRSTGASGVSTAAPSPDTSLWNNATNMAQYSTVLLPCAGSSGWSHAGGEQTVFNNWLNAGGRAFMNHKSAYTDIMPKPPSTFSNGGAAGFTSTSTWANDNDQQLNFQGHVVGTDARHATFRQWLTDVGAYGGGYISTPAGVIESIAADTSAVPGAEAFEWVKGAANFTINGSQTVTGITTNTWGAHPTGNFNLAYSFDLPVGAATKCGRVSFQGMHVDDTRGTSSGAFPGECSLGPGMTPNELMFEYLLFNLESCAIGDATLSPPPPPRLLPRRSRPFPSRATTTRRAHRAAASSGNVSRGSRSFRRRRRSISRRRRRTT